MTKEIHGGVDGASVLDHLNEMEAKDPELAKGVRREFDVLQVAHAVRAAREAAGMTQARLAELVGTKQTGIARIESGKHVPRLDLLARIAGEVGCRLVVDFAPVPARAEKAAPAAKPAAKPAARPAPPLARIRAPAFSSNAHRMK